MVLKAVATNIVDRPLSDVRIVLDSYAPRTEFIRGGDHDSPITATQVIDDIVGGDLGHLEHLVHDDHRRRIERGQVGRDVPGGVRQPGSKNSHGSDRREDVLVRQHQFATDSGHLAYLKTGITIELQVARVDETS